MLDVKRPARDPHRGVFAVQPADSIWRITLISFDTQHVALRLQNLHGHGHCESGEPDSRSLLAILIVPLRWWTNAEAAVQIEKLGNQLAKIYDVDILCGYSLGGVEIGMEDHIVQQICAEHSAVYSQ